MALVGPQPVQPVGSDPLDDAGNERRTTIHLGLGEVQAQDPLHEPVGIGRLHPSAAQGLCDHRVCADEPAADLVHRVVDIADDNGDQRLESGQQGLLGR